MRPNSAKTAGNGQKTNKKGKNYAEIEFERLFFELKSDSATNQALIRPSLTISDDGDGPPFCLHGLNALYLEEHGWYRVDARGNKKGVSANFCPPTERLAFPIVTTGEADLPEIWAEPITPVLDVLLSKKTYREVADNLPDIQLNAANKAMHATSA